jgi:hypothetical protein
MIQLSRTQDEEVGDGTTSVIILGEEEWLSRMEQVPSSRTNSLSKQLMPPFEKIDNACLIKHRMYFVQEVLCTYSGMHFSVRVRFVQFAKPR